MRRATPTKGAFQSIVPISFSVLLVFPVGKWMARYGDRAEIVFGRLSRDAGAQPLQVFAGLGDGLADTGSNLDLALKKLRTDLIIQLGLAGVHQRLWRFCQPVAVPIHEEIFLFDAEGKILLHVYSSRMAELQ